MSDFFNVHTQHKSRVERSCIFCAELIAKGDIYTKQTGVFESSWFASHYHDECFEEMCEGPDGEFIPYSNERPQVNTGAKP